MQARSMRAVSVTSTALEIMGSSGLSLLISEAALSCDGTGRSSRSHQSPSMAMVGGVSHATMFRKKATMWPLSAVLFA